MNDHFHLFSPVHLLILASVPAFAILLSMAARHSRASARWTRYTLGGLLALNELAWYAYRLHFEGFRFPEGLPLELCDLTLWFTVFALLTLNPVAFEIAYFAGLGGSGMALVTPDLWAPLASYPTIYFFLAHGLVVVCMLMVLWSKQARPRPGSPWKVFAALNAYGAAITSSMRSSTPTTCICVKSRQVPRSSISSDRGQFTCLDVRLLHSQSSGCFGFQSVINGFGWLVMRVLR